MSSSPTREKGPLCPNEMVWIPPHLSSSTSPNANGQEDAQKKSTAGKANSIYEEEDEEEEPNENGTLHKEDGRVVERGGRSASSSWSTSGPRVRKWETQRRLYTVTQWEHHRLPQSAAVGSPGGTSSPFTPFRFASIPIPEYQDLMCVLIPLSSDASLSSSSPNPPVTSSPSSPVMSKTMVYATALSEPLHELKWYSAPRNWLASASTGNRNRPTFPPSRVGNGVAGENSTSAVVYDGQSISKGWIAYRAASSSASVKKTDWKQMDVVAKEEVEARPERDGEGEVEEASTNRTSGGGRSRGDDGSKSDIDAPLRIIPAKNRLPRRSVVTTAMPTSSTTREGEKEVSSGEGEGKGPDDEAHASRSGMAGVKRQREEPTGSTTVPTGVAASPPPRAKHDPIPADATLSSAVGRFDTLPHSLASASTPFQEVDSPPPSSAPINAPEEENLPVTAAAVIREWRSGGHHASPSLSDTRPVSKEENAPVSKRSGTPNEGESRAEGIRPAAIPLSQLEKMVLKALPTYHTQSEKFKNPQTKSQANQWFRTRREELRQWLSANGFLVDPAGNVYI